MPTACARGASWRLQVLGRTNLWVGERDVTPTRPVLVRLLCVLASSYPSPLSATVLASRVWDLETDAESAAARVYPHMCRLRALAPGLLEGTRSAYVLALAPRQIDVVAFRADRHATAAAHEPAKIAELSEGALSLWASRTRSLGYGKTTRPTKPCLLR